MSLSSELEHYLRARFTLIVIASREEERVLRTVETVCDDSGRQCLAWDVADGFKAVTEWNGAPPNAPDPLTALEQAEKQEGQVLFVLKDFHEAWENPKIKRKLRNVAQKLKYTKKSVIVTAPESNVPTELQDAAVVIDYPLPGEDEIEEVLSQITDTPGVEVNLTQLGREKIIQAALGLSAMQAQRVFAKAVVQNGTMDDRDIELVTSEKKEIIRESEALEFYPATETPDNVGGLGALKKWLRLRERAFAKEARDYGLPVPKGIALIGIPGTGKSLAAKMIGGLWRLPLLRLDVGALFGSLVGESEERVQRALHLAETVAPCIVWIDEMEKALAQGALDGGTSQRVFGAILTWMQEKTAPCFVVATANDISRLPPELLRKGRFDEIFFLDLPTREERREIFKVHLRMRNRLAEDYNLDRMAQVCKGYVGAEIEQAILDAMYVGFDEDREFTTADVLMALDQQVPLSVAQRETIEHLRNWMREGRARSASFQETEEAQEQFVPLEVNA